ncbi:MAG: hypothetical protein ABI488_04975 [Polyangiaceae bacterium]
MMRAVRLLARRCYRLEHLVAHLLLNDGEEHTFFKAYVVSQRGAEVRETLAHRFRRLLDEASQRRVLVANAFGQLTLPRRFDGGQNKFLFDCKVRHQFEAEARHDLGPYRLTSAWLVALPRG